MAELKNHLSPVYSNASEIAVIYTGLGDSDQAMYWLQKAHEERFNPSVLLRPGLDPLRNDPRFQALVRRIGLPQLNWKNLLFGFFTNRFKPAIPL